MRQPLSQRNVDPALAVAMESGRGASVCRAKMSGQQRLMMKGREGDGSDNKAEQWKHALSKGDVHRIRGILSLISSSEAVTLILQPSSGDGSCALHTAVKANHSHVFEELMQTLSQEQHDRECEQQGSHRITSVDVPDYQGVTPFMLSTRLPTTTILTILIDHGVNLQKQDTRGWTVLHHAAFNGNSDAATMIIKRGGVALIDKEDLSGALPEDLAEGYPSLIKILRKKYSKSLYEGMSKQHSVPHLSLNPSPFKKQRQQASLVVAHTPAHVAPLPVVLPVVYSHGVTPTKIKSPRKLTRSTTKTTPTRSSLVDSSNVTVATCRTPGNASVTTAPTEIKENIVSMISSAIQKSNVNSPCAPLSSPSPIDTTVTDIVKQSNQGDPSSFSFKSTEGLRILQLLGQKDSKILPTGKVMKDKLMKCAESSSPILRQGASPTSLPTTTTTNTCIPPSTTNIPIKPTLTSPKQINKIKKNVLFQPLSLTPSRAVAAIDAIALKAQQDDSALRAQSMLQHQMQQQQQAQMKMLEEMHRAQMLTLYAQAKATKETKKIEKIMKAVIQYEREEDITN